MSGGETEGQPKAENKDTESSEAKETLSGYEDVVEGLSEESEVEEDEEALKEKSSDEAGPQTVLDKSQKGQK